MAIKKEKMIKLFKPYVSLRAKWNVLKVLSGTQLAEGPQVKLFEDEFSTRFGFPRVVSLNSGTSALALSYELAGINEGDEVITPVLTCTATNLPLIHRGAKIVFADIDEDLNINIEDVKAKITPRTKAIVFVHFGGNNRGLKEILDLTRGTQIKVIEDAAQAIGSATWGLGDYTCVSLQAIKTLTSGDGGILICKDEKDHEKAKRLRWFGYDRNEKQRLGDTDLTESGYKYHMNDISASIGRGNLRSLRKILTHRKRLQYIYKFYGLFAHSWLAGGFTDDYEALKARYAREGIEIGQHHYRNDKYTVFGGREELPWMDALENSYFFVPYHYGVSFKQAHKIGRIFKESLT